MRTCKVWKSEYVPGVYGSVIQTGNSGASVAAGKVVLVDHYPNDAGSAIGMFIMAPGTTDLRPSALAVPHCAMSTTPVYCDGRLFLRRPDHVACRDLTKPGPEEMARIADKLNPTLTGRRSAAAPSTS